MSKDDVNPQAKVRQATQDSGEPYDHLARLALWLQDIPVEFPSDLTLADDLPAFFNPIIGPRYKDSCENVSNILEMLRNLAFPSYTEKADFSLSEAGTYGLISVLECITSALIFERNYRNNDYESFG